MRGKIWKMVKLLSSGVLWVVILRWGWGLDWQWIAASAAGVYIGYTLIRGIAADAVNEVWDKSFSSASGTRSTVFARVWTLTLELTNPFLEQLTHRLSSRPELKPIVLAGLWKASSSPSFLRQLKIEEYANRIRVHRWLLPDPTDADTPVYEWWDFPPGVVYGSSPRSGEELWSYSTDSIDGVLHLSALCQFQEPTNKHKRSVLKLVLWFDPGGSESRDPVPKEDIFFEIPLDPGLLDDAKGQTVYVKGEKRKASEVLPYPSDSESWETKQGEGESWQWSWYLRMQTFNQSFL